jgi:transglutaminase-like putative cysteine protease
MKKTFYTFSLCSLLLMTACVDRSSHFVREKAAREQIAQDFAQKCAAMPAGDLFDLSDTTMTLAEREALMFLYAYMPAGDVTDYAAGFYLDNIRASFRVREEMPWGKTIPDDIFRHFVLPVRVNNENLDESRIIFYDELKERVKDLPLREAVLEVNHWCHEKVIYTPSDSRTSSPLASVRTAYGRCGEESVFTVAALRAVGIPARQVYTPRWAHTDDNHAWVEAWVDGRWHFMGACEPEPVLDMAWFNAPAARGMLMHTKVFGRYEGPEDVMERTPCYTEINVINNYAPTARAVVRVKQADGTPAIGANVEFKLYNYAEFYTVARKTADKTGVTSLMAGKGDMLVWASLNGYFGFAKLSFGKVHELCITLDHQVGDPIDLPIDIVPPVEGLIPSSASDEQKAENARRLAEEDRLRNQYISTFYTEAQAKALASETNLESERVWKIMEATRGNWQEIEAFLRQTPAKDKAQALSLLEAISAKDLRDTRASVLADHLENSRSNCLPEYFVPYVMNPRVANELLTPYKSYIEAVTTDGFKELTRIDAQTVANWIHEEISVSNDYNPQNIPMSPEGVWRSRVADVHSSKIFFVAMARGMHVPARIDKVTGKVQYIDQGRWVDANFSSQILPDIPVRGTLTATYSPRPSLTDPKYFSHFTIARIQPDGSLRTLNFEAEAQVDMGRGDTWSRLLTRPLPMDEGEYLLITGTRMARGNIMAQLRSFTIRGEQATTVELLMRESSDDIQVIGNIDAEATYRSPEDAAAHSILSTTGRGYFVLALLGAHQEPTNHALRDIAAYTEAFNKWGRSMVLLFPTEAEYNSFDPKEFPALPSTITYGWDDNGGIRDMLTTAMQITQAQSLPIFVIADTFGRVVFFSQGYTIGLGEQLLQTIGKI